MSELVITWQGLLFEAASFLIFTYLLNLFLFKPIRKILKERESILSSHKVNKENFEDLTKKLYESAEQEKNKLKIEINGIRESYKKEGLAEAHRVVDEARKKASKNLAEALKNFDKEKNDLIKDYMLKSEEIADLISKKIINL
ncbi:MAG: ATP synthase F0 subunit B [Deltaproteobacteria bacterium]|nr:ATP synthase F0 subunit B [Deltaproteobacteria bacterium]